MKRIALFFLICVAFGQTAPAPPSNLTATVQTSCSPWLLSCVSQVNGKPVCPYGRVAAYPLPGQPYTPWTYPQNDPQGNPVNFLKCVYELPSCKGAGSPNFPNEVCF